MRTYIILPILGNTIYIHHSNFETLKNEPSLANAEEDEPLGVDMTLYIPCKI